MNYIVGEWYDLPVVYRPIWNSATHTLDDFPLVVLHDHVGDVSGDRHIHLDNRFIPHGVMPLLGIRPDEILASKVYDDDKMEVAHVQCVNSYVLVRPYHDNVKFIEQVQEMQANKRRTTDRCPHQGCDLSGLDPVEVDGVACTVCPCHGLAWAVEDGRMVRRNYSES